MAASACLCALPPCLRRGFARAGLRRVFGGCRLFLQPFCFPGPEQFLAPSHTWVVPTHQSNDFSKRYGFASDRRLSRETRCLQPVLEARRPCLQSSVCPSRHPPRGRAPPAFSMRISLLIGKKNASWAPSVGLIVSTLFTHFCIYCFTFLLIYRRGAWSTRTKPLIDADKSQEIPGMGEIAHVSCVPWGWGGA
jgi:hypothetical protein